MNKDYEISKEHTERVFDERIKSEVKLQGGEKMGDMADYAREQETDNEDNEDMYADLNEEAEIKDISPKPIRTFYIAGVQHHQMHMALKDITVGDNLLLIPEPTNKFDINAIRIEYARHDKQTMLGYVPRKFSPEIAGLLEIDTRLECVVTEFVKENKPWEQCKVEIKEFKEEE